MCDLLTLLVICTDELRGIKMGNGEHIMGFKPIQGSQQGNIHKNTLRLQTLDIKKVVFIQEPLDYICLNNFTEKEKRGLAFWHLCKFDFIHK